MIYAWDDLRMRRPRRLPERGDVSKALVAQRLGMSPADFERLRSAFEERGFPESDVTTGLYAVEAVDRRRLRRYLQLFPDYRDHPATSPSIDAMP
jgi:hypothetical protein